MRRQSHAVTSLQSTETDQDLNKPGKQKMTDPDESPRVKDKKMRQG